MRAQIIADKPTVQEVQPEAPISTSSSIPEASTAAGCPFLNSLTPPEVHVPWLKRLGQITQPTEFQKTLLTEAMEQGHRMVAINKDIGFSDAYMIGNGDAVKAVFQGEAGSNPTIKQSSLPSFGEHGVMGSAERVHNSACEPTTPTAEVPAITYLPCPSEAEGHGPGPWQQALLVHQHKPKHTFTVSSANGTSLAPGS